MYIQCHKYNSRNRTLSTLCTSHMLQLSAVKWQVMELWIPLMLCPKCTNQLKPKSWELRLCQIIFSFIGQCVSILTPSSNGMQERKAYSIRNRKPCLHTCLVFSLCTHALQCDIKVIYMLQHNSAISISSSTLKKLCKFPKFQPTFHNFNRAFFLGKVPGTAH